MYNHLMGEGNVTGYNAGNIVALRDVINTVAQSSSQGICEILHDRIVAPMASVWCAQEAVDFFAGFKTAVQSCGEDIHTAFDTFRGNVQSAGESWAENTGGVAPSLPSIEDVALDLNVEDIKAEENGNVFIIEDSATAIANSLGDVEQEIKSRLEELARQLDAETSFLGHGQAQAVSECFTVINGAISNIFKFLTTGEESLQSQINKAVQKYKDVATDISTGFNNSTAQ